MSYKNYILNYKFEDNLENNNLENDILFQYDYNEVQELFFNKKNNFVFLIGKTGVNKKKMLKRIYNHLIFDSIDGSQILIIDFDIPIFHTQNFDNLIDTFYNRNKNVEDLYVIINEVYILNNWFDFIKKIKNQYPKIKLICSSSVSSELYETLYQYNLNYIKIIVLSYKNDSNIKSSSTTFGVYKDIIKYNVKNKIVEIKGLTTEGKKRERINIPEFIDGYPVKIIASGAFHDRDELINVKIPEGVEMIGDYAFSKCINIKSISFPKSLKYIGDNSFIGAKKLSIVSGGDNITYIGSSAFWGTEWLNNQKNDFVVLGKVLYKYRGYSEFIKVDENILVVSFNAFANSKIKEITFSNLEVEIFEGAFINCFELEKVSIKKNSTIRAFTFFNCIKLKKINSEIKNIEKFSFFNCKSLTSIKLTNKSTIDSCSFYGCSSLKKIDGTPIKISHGAFANSSLENINLSQVNTIGKMAFFRSNIKKIILPKINKIGDFCFSEIPTLKELEITTKASIGKIIFKNSSLKKAKLYGNYTLKYLFMEPKLLELTVLGEIVTNFSRNNKYLEKLNLENIEQFGSWCFYGNINLKEITIKNTPFIGNWAFTYCSKLKVITIPKKTKQIGVNVFRYCKEIEIINLNTEIPLEFGVNSFYSLVKLKIIFVKNCSLSRYKQLKKWENFISIMIKK